MSTNINELIGKVITKIDVSSNKENIKFVCDDGSKYDMYHDQDCCESVYLEDVVGELDNLIDSPILKASEDSNSNEDPSDIPKRDYEPDSFTWTFYNIATIKGNVTLRWFGSSNGYYGESVELHKTKPNVQD